MFVSNDWHAALVPSYLAAKYRRHGVYQARPLLAQTCAAARPSRSAQCVPCGHPARGLRGGAGHARPIEDPGRGSAGSTFTPPAAKGFQPGSIVPPHLTRCVVQLGARAEVVSTHTLRLLAENLCQQHAALS